MYWDFYWTRFAFQVNIADPFSLVGEGCVLNTLLITNRLGDDSTRSQCSRNLYSVFSYKMTTL